MSRGVSVRGVIGKRETWRESAGLTVGTSHDVEAGEDEELFPPGNPGLVVRFRSPVVVTQE